MCMYVYYIHIYYYICFIMYIYLKQRYINSPGLSCSAPVDQLTAIGRTTAEGLPFLGFIGGIEGPPEAPAAPRHCDVEGFKGGRPLSPREAVVSLTDVIVFAVCQGVLFFYAGQYYLPWQRHVQSRRDNPCKWVSKFLLNKSHRSECGIYCSILRKL